MHEDKKHQPPRSMHSSSGRIQHWTRKSRTRQAACSMHRTFDSQGYGRRRFNSQLKYSVRSVRSTVANSTRMRSGRLHGSFFEALAQTETSLGQPELDSANRECISGSIAWLSWLRGGDHGMCVRVGVIGPGRVRQGCLCHRQGRRP